ncbi:MAG: hypothetical protein WCK90_02450 [archaeon]
MPKISQQKRDKIAEQILLHLFSHAPQSKFTSDVAQEIARDEEFTKQLMIELKRKNLVIEVNKNEKGIQFLRRQRWRLSNGAHEIYSRYQSIKQPLFKPFDEL